MSTAILRTFAPAVRNRLVEAVARELDVVLSAQTPDALSRFAALQSPSELERSALVERVAYTWFNRLSALRFLDARGWHPFRARVLTTASAAATRPELLELACNGALPAELLPHLDATHIDDLLEGRVPSQDAQREVYRLLVLAVCRFYHALLPDLFEPLDDATELLLPGDLLTERSVAQGFRSKITDADCADVEVLGWLHQFYFSGKKDQVLARKGPVPTEDIPAATQLFTPRWIVRYLIENSLGRLWLRSHPGSKLRERMPYYIEGEAETDSLQITSPEEIQLIDPAVGSGHMLVYAFDLLALIYAEEGYAEAEIPALILRHNLHGLEICPRAARLAALSLVFKARERASRFFEKGQLVRPAILELREVRFAADELHDYVGALDLGEVFDEPMIRLVRQFADAKTFGSLIQPCLDQATISRARRVIEAREVGDRPSLRETHRKVARALEQAEALTQRYHVAVANPPYMGKKQMNARLRSWCEDQEPMAADDLFAMFLVRLGRLVLPRGYQAMITMHSWMFISQYEDLRGAFLSSRTVSSLLHLGPRAFDRVSGERVQTAAFVVANRPPGDAKGIYARLVEGRSEAEKEQQFHDPARRYSVRQSDFQKLPWKPLIYWMSAQMAAAFSVGVPLTVLAKPRKGFDTGSTSRPYFRAWWEPANGAIHRSGGDLGAARWVEVNKGGECRRWYGNREHVVTFARSGESLYSIEGASIRNRKNYFKPGLTYSIVSSSPLSVRESFPSSVFYQSGGTSVTEDRETQLALLGLLNTDLANRLVSAICPTTNSTVDDVAKFPVIVPEGWSTAGRPLVEACCDLARKDWDSFETSWDFQELPLLRHGLKGATLEASWSAWAARCAAAIGRMAELETENNRVFLHAYGLQNELDPRVPEAHVTLARADVRRDMAAFLSYAVGCMMGRYSLDRPGLVLANAGGTVREYLEEVRVAPANLQFSPAEDGIVPLLDGEWHDDDLVARAREFLVATFGKDTLRENLRFLEAALGKDLRKYFLTDFYKDHLQTYKKRPIYWLVQSPRKAFSALVYVHRYTPDTLKRVLDRYLRPFLTRARRRSRHLAQAPTKSLVECEEWQHATIRPLARRRVALDLDDGVRVNYLKLGQALAPIPGLAAAGE
ncbi:MAG: BREX-1 system adenine-specific DNA-methyltransferase PglX [Byssovorax sp.]